MSSPHSEGQEFEAGDSRPVQQENCNDDTDRESLLPKEAKRGILKKTEAQGLDLTTLTLNTVDISTCDETDNEVMVVKWLVRSQEIEFPLEKE